MDAISLFLHNINNIRIFKFYIDIIFTNWYPCYGCDILILHNINNVSIALVLKFNLNYYVCVDMELAPSL